MKKLEVKTKTPGARMKLTGCFLDCRPVFWLPSATATLQPPAGRWLHASWLPLPPITFPLAFDLFLQLLSLSSLK
jgi:hypothetical protein